MRVLDTCWSAIAAGVLLAGCLGGGGASDPAEQDGWAVEPDADLDTTYTQGPDSSSETTCEDCTTGDTAIEQAVPGPSAVDYLVIAANDLLPTADAFASYRAGTGYRAEVVSLATLGFEGGDPAPSEVAKAIHGRVRAEFEARDPDRPFHVLIVGDAEPGVVKPSTLVPAPFEAVGWESAFSDNVYSDMDGDHVPDLSIGRIPVRTNDDGLRILEKVRRHETTYEPGPWNRRLAAYAGTGDFGPEADYAIELAVRKTFEEIPYDFDIRFAYDNPASEYYYDPFPAKALEYLTWGSMLTTYVGHGGGETAVGGLHGIVCQHRCPMLAFLACGTGDFLQTDDSDPEFLMKHDGSPFELLVSQTTTHPYGNAILGRELGMAVFEERAPTFGEAVQRAKWRTRYNDDELRQLVDALASALMSDSEMDDVIPATIYAYNLLGDPALQMRFPPARVTLDVSEDEVAIGSDLSFHGTVGGMSDGTARVTLEVEVTVVPWNLDPVPAHEDPTYQSVVQANHEKAMDKVIASVEVPIVGGEFSGSLVVPQTAPGRLYVKVLAMDGHVDGVSHVPLDVVKPQ